MLRSDSVTNEIGQLLAVVQARRKYYRDVLSQLPAAVAVLAGDGSIRYANSAFCRQFSIPEDDVQNHTIGQLLPSEVVTRAILAARLSGIPQPPAAFQVGHASWRISITPVDNWNNSGEIGSLLFIENSREIWQAALTTSQLALSLSLPEQLIDDQVPAIVWQADRVDRVFHSVRGGVEEILGYPAEHWKTAPDFFSNRIYSDDRPATLACYRAAIEQGGDASAEFRGASPTGLVWLRETIRVSGLVITGVITPIGARKSLEEQRLANERIQVLNCLATQSARSLDDAVRTVRSSPLIESAVEQTARIAASLRGSDPAPPNPPTVINLARRLASLRGQIAARAGAHISVDFHARQPVLAFAEESQLEEILFAVTASICRDALDGSKLSITCDVHNVTDQFPGAPLNLGTYARLTFHHQGRGLEFELQGPLFESRFDSILASPKRVTLPALSRAYAIVQDWGGDIAFLSEPDRATFCLYLPHCPSFDLDQDPAPRFEIIEDEPGQKTSYRDLVDLLLAELASEQESVLPDLADSLSSKAFEPDRNLLERPLS